MREQIHNLQALRGVASLMVVWYHLAPWADRMGVTGVLLSAPRWFGFAGVDLFFVLSGFIIAHTTFADRGRPRAVPRYLFRRLWRIYPTYWVALVGSAALGASVFAWPVFRAESLGDWVRWVTLAPMLPANIVIPPAWTLTYEVMFYLAFGVLLVLPVRWGTVGLAAWAAVVAVANARGHAPGGMWAGLPLSPFVLEFLGGVLVAALVRRGVCVGPRLAIGGGIAVAAVGIAVAHRLNPDLPFESLMGMQRPRVLVFAPAAVLIVYGAAAAELRKLRRPPRWLLRVGDASYSIYLIHSTVQLAAVGLWVVLPFRFPRVPWLFGMFVASVVIGVLFYRTVERPLLNLVRRKKPKPEAKSRPVVEIEVPLPKAA